jgi:hypothetical protein
LVNSVGSSASMRRPMRRGASVWQTSHERPTARGEPVNTSPCDVFWPTKSPGWGHSGGLQTSNWLPV